MKTIDLHTHSTASDGSLSPTELVRHAVEKGLSAIALTDHDTIDGIREAMVAAAHAGKAGHPFELIPGIEFSTEYEGRDVHVLGLFIDIHNDFLIRRLIRFEKSRNRRNVEMAERLTAAGMPVSMEELRSEFPDSVITRAHFARMLFKKGFVKTVREAFDRFIGDGRPCYIRRRNISPMRAVEIIRKAGGFPVLAHPVLCHMSSSRLDTLVGRLTAAGLMGIEAVYSTYDPSDERDMRRLADKYGLVISGGSDFHGKAKPGISLGTGKGKLFLPYSMLDTIREAHKKMLSGNGSYRLRKILFTDLDETLLKRDKSISGHTFDVLRRWTEAGHLLVLNSGRDCNSIRKVWEDLGLNRLQNVYLVGYDGGEAVDPFTGEVIYRVALKKEDVDYLEEAAARYGVHLHAYSETHIIAHFQSEELTFYQKTIKTPVIFSKRLGDALTDGPCKLLAIEITDRERILRFRDDLTPWADAHGISFLFSTDRLMEIFPASSGKGTAVKKLTGILGERLGLPGLCTVAAGDQQNDLSMLEESDIAIAMCNGIEELKEVASLVTEYDNEHDGLALELEDLI
ncbi:MAG: HAD-IIB family hydrolase [Lachnospiraceae bacterium]|nr:HAD-IIB family hydrolase [Lachnospiraceae bacterium]